MTADPLLPDWPAIPARRRPKPRLVPRDVKDVLPDPDWKPKSKFFQSIWKEAEFRVNHPRMRLTCPHCNHDVVMQVAFLGDEEK